MESKTFLLLNFYHLAIIFPILILLRRMIVLLAIYVIWVAPVACAMHVQVVYVVDMRSYTLEVKCVCKCDL